MSPEQMAAGAALADVLERENAALTALDLAGAAALYAQKEAATKALAAAPARAHDAEPLDDEARAAAQELAERLRDLAGSNRRLLERGIFVQGRVLATIARALRAPPPSQPPRYARSGTIDPAVRQQAMMLSARA